MLVMIEKGLRGGISIISRRYSEAKKNIWKIIIQINQVNLFNILMKIIYMVGH